MEKCSSTTVPSLTGGDSPFCGAPFSSGERASVLFSPELGDRRLESVPEPEQEPEPASGPVHQQDSYAGVLFGIERLNFTSMASMELDSASSFQGMMDSSRSDSGSEGSGGGELGSLQRSRAASFSGSASSPSLSRVRRSRSCSSFGTIQGGIQKSSPKKQTFEETSLRLILESDFAEGDAYDDVDEPVLRAPRPRSEQR